MVVKLKYWSKKQKVRLVRLAHWYNTLGLLG